MTDTAPEVLPLTDEELAKLRAQYAGMPEGLVTQLLATISALKAELSQAKSMLARAMEHGLNGNRYYDAMKAGDLGDEVKALLRATRPATPTQKG